jgi:undecaprenyl-diphosphatase
MAPDGLTRVWRRYRVPLLWSLVGWAALTGLLVVAGVAVVHSGPVNAFDHRVTTTVVAHRSPALDAAMKVMTWLGSWVALVVTACVLLVLAARKRLPWVVVLLAVVAWAGEAGGVALVKRAVHRQRPPQSIRLISAHGWSWPSGHTATAVLLFTVLAVVVTILGRPGPTRVVVWLAAVLAVALVAFSRVELGVHWFTDVIASTVFVIAWLTVLALAFRPKRVSDFSVSGPQPVSDAARPLPTDHENRT